MSPFVPDDVCYPDLQNKSDDEVSDCDEEEICTYEQHNTLLHLASHTKRGTDLTKIFLPTFLSEPCSLLETISNFWNHANLFLSITEMQTSRERMLVVLKWYLTSFHMGLNFMPGKKPHNPILGEVFRCSWKVDKSELRFVAEQVSHYPPVTAFYVECPEKKLYLNGYLSPRSIFTGMSIDVSFTGCITLSLGEHGEHYNLSLPTVHARSIISKPWVQLGGKVLITCPVSGLTACVSHPKLFFGEKPHQVIGEVKETSVGVLYKFQGDWKTCIRFCAPGADSEKSMESITIADIPVYRKRVRRLGQQALFESRKLWACVNAALREGDITTAEIARRRITEEQRLRLAKEQRRPMYFEEHEGGWIYKNYPFQSYVLP